VIRSAPRRSACCVARIGDPAGVVTGSTLMPKRTGRVVASHERCKRGGVEILSLG
jgi:hypothetical protein